MEEQRRTDLIVEELRRIKGQGKAAVVEEEKSKYVIFTLHGALYAFEGADVREILPSMDVFPVPGAPESVPGVINNRGDIEAVINLHAVLGLPASEDAAGRRIVMIEKDGVRSGVLVDSVVDVVDLPPSSIAPALPTLDDATRELVIGETLYQRGSVVLLGVSRIIATLRTHGR